MHSPTIKVHIVNECWVGKDVKGMKMAFFMVPQHFPARNEEAHDKPWDWQPSS
jgi:hypothetical protein